MKKKTLSLLEQWEKATQVIEKSREGGFTTRELAELLGIGRNAAQIKLQSAIGRGVVRYVGRQARTDITGMPRYVPVYQICSTTTKSTSPTPTKRLKRKP